MTNSLKGSTSISSGGSGSSAGRRKRSLATEYPISVDDSIEKVLIMVTTQNSGAGITLLDPKGKSITIGRMPLAKGVLYEIANPVAGVYKLTVPVSAGQYKYKVTAVSGTNIDFGHYYTFIPLRGRARVPVPIDQPLKGIYGDVGLYSRLFKRWKKEKKMKRERADRHTHTTKTQTEREIPQSQAMHKLLFVMRKRMQRLVDSRSTLASTFQEREREKVIYRMRIIFTGSPI